MVRRILTRMKIVGISSSTTENRLVLNRSYHNAFTRPGVVPVALPILPAPNREVLTVAEYCEMHQERLAALMQRLDCVVLSGGPDCSPLTFEDSNWASASHDMERDMMEIGLIRAAIDAGKPIMGICKGMQGLGRFIGLPYFAQDLAACGVKGEIHNGLDHDIKDRTEPVHSVYLHGDYLDYVRAKTGDEEIETMRVTSFHHQGFLLGPIKDGKLGFKKGGGGADPYYAGIAAHESRGVRVISTTDLVLEGFEKADIKACAFQSHPEDIPNSLAIDYWLSRYVLPQAEPVGT